MAASEALHPEQMKLFMTGPEIKERVTSSMDLGHTEDMPGLWDRKWKQSGSIYHAYDDNDQPTGLSLRDSIAKHGYQETEPVHLVHSGYSDQGASLADAHHRVAVMSRLHPDQFMSVQHHASAYDTTSTTGQWVSDYHAARKKRERAAWSEEM